MVIVLFFPLLLRSSVSPHYIKRRRKDVWIGKGDFPTAFSKEKYIIVGSLLFWTPLHICLSVHPTINDRQAFQSVPWEEKRNKKESDNITRRASTDMVDIDMVSNSSTQRKAGQRYFKNKYFKDLMSEHIHWHMNKWCEPHDHFLFNVSENDLKTACWNSIMWYKKCYHKLQVVQ